jgi:hypothetical protein
MADRPLHVSELITLLQTAEFEHGDRPVYAVTSTEVLAVIRTGYDTYDLAEGRVIEIITEEGDE